MVRFVKARILDVLDDIMLSNFRAADIRESYAHYNSDEKFLIKKPRSTFSVF